MTVEELAEQTNRLRHRTRVMQQRHQLGEATYDEMVAIAKEFCRSFDEYHKAKFGKGKRLDYRAILR